MFEPKNKPKDWRDWLAYKLVKIAKKIKPESDAVKSFYLELMTDWMIEGKYVTKIDWDKVATKEEG